MSANIWAPGGEILVSSDNAVVHENFNVSDPNQSQFVLTTFSYVPGTGSLMVFLNGAYQRSGIDYYETSNASFTFINHTFVIGDTVSAVGQTSIAAGPVNPWGTAQEVQVATAGQTVFTIASPAYLAQNGSLRVFRNGLLEEVGESYIEDAGNTVVFSEGLDAGDEVTFVFNSEIGIGQESAYVNYLPAGTGAVATDVQSKLRNIPYPTDYSTNIQYVNRCLQLSTGENFAQNGAIVHRLVDKVFIGGAIENDASFPNIEKDWLTDYQNTLLFQDTIGVRLSGVTTSGSPIITFTAAAFVPTVGKPIYGTGIPAGATITSVDSATQLTISANATLTTSKNTFFSGGTNYLSGSGLSANTFGLTNNAGSSAVGGLFGSRSANFSSASASCIGVFGYAVNNSSLGNGAWGGYFEVHVENELHSGRGIEIDVRSIVAQNKSYPFTQGKTSALQLGSGCGIVNANQSDISAAIQIVANPNKFRTGITFTSDSLEGTEGSAGGATAIAMAPFQAIEWFNETNSVVGRVMTTNTDAAKKTEIKFATQGVQLLGANSQTIGYWFGSPSSVNYPALHPSNAGGGVIFSANGSDSNIDIQLATKGTGVLRFGTYSATGDAACNGYITIKDSSGTVRKLMTTA